VKRGRAFAGLGARGRIPPLPSILPCYATIERVASILATPQSYETVHPATPQAYNTIHPATVDATSAARDDTGIATARPARSANIAGIAVSCDATPSAARA
jgi:hypothetical protein